MYFTFIIIALFGLASNLTPAGATNADLQLEYPGLQCIYNDYLYTDGQTIEVFRGACSKLVCRVVPSSFGIGFTSRIFLENLDRCQCSIITPRIPFPLVTLNKVIGAAENLVDKTVSNIVSNFYIGRDQGCYFNNTFVKMNEFVEHLPSKCALLQCNIHDGRPVIELFVKSICFCRATPDPTTTVTVTASPTVTATASPSPTSTTSSPGTTATTSTSTLPTVTVTATASPVPTSTVTITASPSSTTSSFPSSTITVTVTATPTSIITVTVTPTATTASSTSTTATTASSTSTTATTATSTSTTAPTSTSTSTTATTATSTTNASATTSSISGFSRRAGLVAVEEDGGGCDAYSSVSTRHSMCLPPNQRCSVLASGVPAAAKKAIVAAHNSYRVKVARGWESRGLNGPQPEAANLYQLSWNEELARIAQAWAFQCQLLSDCYECRAPITRPYTFTGQNVHQLLAVSSRHSHSNRMNAAREWGIVIDSWYSEVAHVDENIVRSFTPVSQNQTIGHYTQMLWASTYEIGCGQVTFGPCVEFVNNAPAFREKCQIFVCNYGPAGNLITQPIYSIGPAASQCLHGPSQQFSELCSPKPSWN
ncbi:uncharacterized protein LOC108670361 [Hyalella azteca]|uniref:Uncharacterized protein LOC108670361 n=1 Tax=Hyalella azteca TaxID=294128 RepID=A0A8B7NI58_HYAAZ|nr:uncharacterized protein LOC108670361 [Hyalella azteca]